MVERSPEEELADGLRRALEVGKLVREYPDQLVAFESLKRLSHMLSLVNWILFGIASWLAFVWLAPIVDGDTRPAWSMWLIFGPLFGLTFGGLGSAVLWSILAYPLGRWLFRWRRDETSEDLWGRFISANWDRFKG